MTSSSQTTTGHDEVKTNLINYFAYFAAKNGLDTLFLILLVSLGSLSDFAELRSFAKFSCVLLACNFIFFITVYPAFMSLLLQVSICNSIRSNQLNLVN
jgi:hypothetical protein